MATVKDPWELALMRQSGRRLAEVAAVLRESVRPGLSTRDLDAIAEREIRGRSGVPSFKGYTAGGNRPYPATICASKNEQVVHGIPDDVPLVDGDIVSIDVGLVYGGYHADSAFTIAVGEVPARVRQLLDETERSLYEGIARARPGNRVGDIGHAIQAHIDPFGYGIVREYVGHGIGRLMHEAPSVPNYGRPAKGHLLKEGMCLAVEPMITMGSHETRLLEDGWTVVTVDGSLAAHFEHTIAVTPRGPEILTVLEQSRHGD
ncbi:MAG: type I methionyl aminopeptidase [Myxococcota bacterium]